MKKILKVLLVVIMLAACTITAHAASSELDGYPITVHDWITPAVFAAGTDWPITNWYLYAENGEVLGGIPANVVAELSKYDPIDSIQWEFRLADAFNDYRQMTGDNPQQAEPTKPSEEKELFTEIALPATELEQSDTDNLALQAFAFINQARVQNDLHELEISKDAMALAQLQVPNWKTSMTISDRMAAGSPKPIAAVRSSTAGHPHRKLRWSFGLIRPDIGT